MLAHLQTLWPRVVDLANRTNGDQAPTLKSPYRGHVSVTAKAIWYIESHLSGDLSLDAVAAVAEVSRFHLSRAFPASTGYSLSGYIRSTIRRD
jgi:transcriptional regulator GlxA family with amidase domain